MQNGNLRCTYKHLHPANLTRDGKLTLAQAGPAAAFTVDMLIFPLDTLKTRYQSQDYLKTYSSSSKTKSSKPLALRGLYQGIGSAVLATLPAGKLHLTTPTPTPINQERRDFLTFTITYSRRLLLNLRGLKNNPLKDTPAARSANPLRRIVRRRSGLVPGSRSGRGNKAARADAARRRR